MSPFEKTSFRNRNELTYGHAALEWRSPDVTVHLPAGTQRVENR